MAAVETKPSGIAETNFSAKTFISSTDTAGMLVSPLLESFLLTALTTDLSASAG
jgi:hypothetical protein